MCRHERGRAGDPGRSRSVPCSPRSCALSGERMGLLQREFAEKAHVSVSSVKQYEAGKKKPDGSSLPGAMPSTDARVRSGGCMTGWSRSPTRRGSAPGSCLRTRRRASMNRRCAAYPDYCNKRQCYANAVIRACPPYDTEEELERDAAARVEREQQHPDA